MEIKFLSSEYCQIQLIPHLSIDLQLVNIPDNVSPLLGNNQYHKVFGGRGFLPQSSFVYHNTYIINKTQYCGKIENQKFWLTAGPRKNIYFQPKQVKAAIVTCGGLCPGLNVVIREIVLCLNYLYTVKQIYGVMYGYRGFYDYDWIKLDSSFVRKIQNEGGTILGSSRGGFDKQKICKKLVQNGINQVYIIGGDGTHRGIYQLYKFIKQNKLQISLVGIPKTIDNDIPIIDNSFGFQTSVSEAIRAIRSGLVQSRSADYGIGLIRLMGRSAGWIAMEASNASRDVDICLIPQFKFNLYGEKGVLNYIYQTLKVNRHMVIVVAEGAGDADSGQKDLSGNPKMPDIGLLIKKQIIDYTKKKGLEVTLKYIDPTYMIRSVAANALDKKKCIHLASAAVHGAMAGFTGFTVGNINGSGAMIPIEAINKEGVNKIKTDSRTYKRMLQGTRQPSFLQ